MVDSMLWTPDLYLREERFPQLRGEVSNNAGSLDISLTRPTWQDVTLQNSWVSFNEATHYKAQVCLDNFGFVHVRGTIKNGTFADGTIIGTIPAECRPAMNCSFLVVAVGTGVYLNFYPNGDIKIYGATNNTYLHMLGLYPLEV